MGDRMRWGSGSDWDNDGWWGGGCAPCPPAPCPPPPVCTAQPCPPVAMPPCPPPWFGPPRPPWYPGATGGVSFGTTAPQFPIRGHFWWDGALLHMWDGVEWETIGPTPPSAGGTGIPEAPIDGQNYLRQNGAWVVAPVSALVFGMTQPSSITLTASTWSQLPYSATPGIDIQNGWDAPTHRFIAKKAGVYLFVMREYSLATTGTVAIELFKNDSGTHNTGTLIAVQSITSSLGTAGGYMSASGVTQMNGTTDYVRAWGYTTSGTMYGAGGDFVLTATLLS
jgi:hypothetical protein